MKTILLTSTIFLFMAISCKKGSVIPFDDSFLCNNDNYDSCVAVQSGDTSYLQFDLSTIEDMNILSNGTFASGTGWTTGAYWTITGGKAEGVGLGFPASNLYKELDQTLINGGYYQITFDIVSDSNAIDMTVKIGGINVGQLTGVWNVAQTVNLFAIINSPSNNRITFELGIGDFTIDNVTVKQLSRVGIELRDCTTDEVIVDIDSNNSTINYFETREQEITPVFPITQPTQNYLPYVQVLIDWAILELAEDCYCVCVKDVGLIGFDYLLNGKFDSNDFWSITNTGLQGFAIASNQMVHTSEIPGGSDTFEQTLNVALSGEENHVLSFDVIDATTWSVSIYYDTALLTNELLGTLSGSGNSTETIAINEIAATKIRFSVGATNDTVFDNITLKREEVTIACSCVSVLPVSYKDSHLNTSPENCNMLLTAWNDNDAYGFYSEFGYKFTLRVFGRVRVPKYEFQNEELLAPTNGNFELASVKIVKSKELQIQPIHETLHDVLSLVLGCQNIEITINDSQPIAIVKKSGNYTPVSYRNYDDYGAIVEILPKSQDKYMTLGS